MRRSSAAALAAISMVAALAWLPAPVRAQSAPPDTTEPPSPVVETRQAPADSAAAADSTAAADEARADSTSRVASKKPSVSGEERDRWEFGVAIPQGYFDLLGTAAYRRLIRTRYPFEQTLKIELTGGGNGYLVEGSMSAYYLLRPIRSYRQSWRIRPLVEVGPGFHWVFESASIEGFSEYSYHSRAYLKLHGYLGAEFLVTHKFGFLLCGRVTIPDHQPLDYAQAAIFFR